MAGATQDTTRIGHQRKDMAGLNQVTGLRVAGRRRLNGAGTVRGRNTGCHAHGRLNGQGKLGTKTGGVLLDHQRKTQLLTAVPGHGHADEAAAKTGHEVDGLSRAMLGGHHQITLILAILVIHQYDHLALTNIFNDVFNTVQCHMVLHPCGVPAAAC